MEQPLCVGTVMVTMESCFAVLVRRGRQTSCAVPLHHSSSLYSEPRLGFQNSRSKHLFFSTDAIGWSARLSSLSSKSKWRTIAATWDDSDICVDEHKQWHFPTMCTDGGKTLCEKHKHGVWTISVWKECMWWLLIRIPICAKFHPMDPGIKKGKCRDWKWLPSHWAPPCFSSLCCTTETNPHRLFHKSKPHSCLLKRRFIKIIHSWVLSPYTKT